MGPLMIILFIIVFAIVVQVVNDWDSVFPKSPAHSRRKSLKDN
ncbi:hypothetical protein [Pediococcus cellicola]|nr:hypothetical protein [Pediococcus cellicola]GEL14301.1 hypothetical protein PCE01_01030 [Pediococcus cellicola]